MRNLEPLEEEEEGGILGQPLATCCDTDHGAVGCCDNDCEMQVCAIDTFCCDTAWDGICADEADLFDECSVCTPLQCSNSCSCSSQEDHDSCNAVEIPVTTGSTPSSVAYEIFSETSSSWFHFTAPASGCVTVETDNTDLEMTIWSATDCSDFGTFDEIASNLDCSLGFTVPYVVLSPGGLYYIQVNGGVSSGNISVLEVDCEDVYKLDFNFDLGQNQTLVVIPNEENDNVVMIRNTITGNTSNLIDCYWSGGEFDTHYESTNCLGTVVQPNETTTYCLHVYVDSIEECIPDLTLEFCTTVEVVEACAGNLSNACAFVDDEEGIGKTSLCVKHHDDHYHNKCFKDDDIYGLGPGDFIGDYEIMSCGCCGLNEAVMEDILENDVEWKEADEDYCTKPICTPNDDGWQVCEVSGKTGIVKEIAVCVDGVTLCIDPFEIVEGIVITCGVC